MLALLKDRVKFDLYKDTSHNGLEAMLMKQAKVIVYVSRKLKDFKTKYPTYDLELVIIAFTLKI